MLQSFSLRLSWDGFVWLKLEPCLFAGTNDIFLKPIPENQLLLKTLPENQRLKGWSWFPFRFGDIIVSIYFCWSWMMFKFFFQPYPFPDSVIYSRMGLLDFLLCKKWPPLAFHSRFWKTKKQNQSISFKNVFSD